MLYFPFASQQTGQLWLISHPRAGKRTADLNGTLRIRISFLGQAEEQLGAKVLL